MRKEELILVFSVITAIVFIFIAGVVFFVFQYRKRKLMYENEKAETEKQHQLDLLNIQLQSQQQTMQHIGQEIHDSVAQKLTLASIYAQRMQFENKLPANADRIDSISKIINDSLLELRQLSQNLTDSKLQNARLEELVRMECEQVNATGTCRAEVETGELPAISIAVKSSLIRIVQEFIQNSIKHSGCRQISIVVSSAGGMLHLSLRDDGKGFDIGAEQHKGAGLDNIRRRIQMLNGTFNFKSEKDNGTVLDLSLPVEIQAMDKT